MLTKFNLIFISSTSINELRLKKKMLKDTEYSNSEQKKLYTLRKLLFICTSIEDITDYSIFVPYQLDSSLGRLSNSCPSKFYIKTILKKV